MGLVFTTRDWTGAAIVMAHADGSATYTVASDTLNAYAVAVAFRDWIADAARPWAAHVSAVTLTVEEDADERRLRFAYTFTGSSFVSITPNATWIARFGDTSASPPGSCPASCSCVVGTVMWEQWDTDDGERSREGSWRFGAADSAHRQPSAELELTLGQAFAFGAAIRLATQPREAYVYDEMGDTWRLVTVGQHSLQHPEGDVTIVTGTLDIIGGVP